MDLELLPNSSYTYGIYIYSSDYSNHYPVISSWYLVNRHTNNSSNAANAMNNCCPIGSS
jgi:hypothetical protein